LCGRRGVRVVEPFVDADIVTEPGQLGSEPGDPLVRTDRRLLPSLGWAGMSVDEGNAHRAHLRRGQGGGDRPTRAKLRECLLARFSGSKPATRPPSGGDSCRVAVAETRYSTEIPP